MKNKQLERRHFVLEGLEVRAAAEDGEAAKIVGHAAVFNSLSEDLGGFREQIAPGAFANSLKTADVRALFNHNPDVVLGRTISGTLKLSEDNKGLAIEISPPDTQAARDLMVSMQRGDITQMSFGFRTVSDKWETRDGVDLRTLVEVDVFDVSPVTYPAYTQANAAVRSSHDQWKASQQEPPKVRSLEDIKRRIRLAKLF